MKRRLVRAVPLILALVLVAAATSCSKASEFHWAKKNGSQVDVSFTLPTSNPFNATNRTAQTEALVADFIQAKWTPHPDLRTRYRTGFGFDNGCPGGDNINCYEVWLVPKDTDHPVSGTLPSCWSGTPTGETCAFAYRWVDTEHWRNGNTSDPARIIIPQEWLTEDFIENVFCHEAGHMYGLEHHDPVTG